jgi:hypothetical protein
MIKKGCMQEKYNKDKKMLLILMFIPCILFQKELNNDIWFLLNSGRYVINYGIPYIEPFTIHANMEFVMQQWLTSVIYWMAYSKLGELGLYLIIMICYVLMIILMYKITILISSNNFIISYLLTILFSILINSFIVTRPMTLTLVLILLELYALEAYIAYNNKKYLIILPIISFLSINIQSAMWPLLFIMIIPYIIDSFYIKIKFIKGQGYEKKYIILVVAMMIILAYINPYGIKSMIYLLNSYGYPEISNTVLEMQPPNINDALGMIIFSFIFVIFLIYCIYRKGTTKIRYFLLTLGTGIMVLSSIRSFPFFAICAIFSLAYYLKDVNYSFNDNSSSKLLLFRKILVVAILTVTMVALLIAYNNKKEDKIIKDLNETIDFILENEEISKVVLYTGYNDGGLTEFRGLASYIDPRAEVFVKKNNKKDDIMKEHIDLQNGNIYYKLVLDKYQFSHLLVSKSDILYTYLPYDDDYEVIYSNDSYKLFKKID